MKTSMEIPERINSKTNKTFESKGVLHTIKEWHTSNGYGALERKYWELVDKYGKDSILCGICDEVYHVFAYN